MSVEKERKAFEVWLKSLNENGRTTYFLGQESTVTWEAWKASKNREGYKLVPVEMSWQKADELASKEWDRNKSMFCVDNRDMSALQVEEFRLRWCKNKAYQIMSDYKAMIEAIE